LASGRQQFRQLGKPHLHACGLSRQVIEQPLSQGELDGKLLFGQFGVPFGLTSLPGKTPDLGLDLGDQVFHPLQIEGGLLQPPFGAVLPVAIESDPRSLLEQGPTLFGPIREQKVDHLCLDHHAGIATEAGAPQKILNVAQPDWRTI
jgi:hypothetical protein